MQTLLQDLRYGARLLLKKPGFTLTAVITLALGISANTVIFGAFNAVMLRPLPYSDPGKIIIVWDSFPQLAVKKIGVTYANFADLKQRTRVFDPLALYAAGSTTGFNLTGLAGPERVQGARATGDFFRALGVSPLIGRTLIGEDEEAGRDHVVVLSYSLWQRDFGGDRSLLGRNPKPNHQDYPARRRNAPRLSFPRRAGRPPGA